VSGERVIPTELLREALPEMARLPGWGAEAFMNDLIIRRRLRLAVVRWRAVANTRKHDKIGHWRGAVEERRMMCDAVSVMTPVGVVRQNIGLLSLANRDAPVPMRWSIGAQRSRRVAKL